jgi:methyl-accepting chemotaxis protein
VAATLVAAAALTTIALLALGWMAPLAADPAALEAARRVVFALGAAAGILAALAVAAFSAVNRDAGAVRRLAAAARGAAAGDLDIDVGAAGSGDLAEVAAGVAALVGKLRQLEEGLARASNETTMMSSEITAGAEEMAAAAGEIASTASDLSTRSAEMATSINSLSTSSTELSELSASLFDGARHGVERNAMLRILSSESREQLDRSVKSLDALASEARASVAAGEQLATESAEVRGFITLVRKLARQSKLLALNAAMEAARAGEQGEGFAVVAGEVRRLATMSSEGAERTAEIVDRVLAGIERTRDWSSRTEQAVGGLHGVVTASARSFSEIEGAIVEFDELAGSIERTAASLDEVARDITVQLSTLSQGTEGFAAAMEQVAASSEQQSASTEEIAGAAATLHATAERLSGLINALRRAG